MQWSKLKTRVKQLICPELRNRIDFHVTSYRGSHDGADKVWFTVDGVTIFSCEHYSFERAESEAYYDGLSEAQMKVRLVAGEIHRPADFGDAIREYLDISVSDALISSDPFIRAFALIDRRIGKKTFENIEVSDSEHALVKAFYELRRAVLEVK